MNLLLPLLFIAAPQDIVTNFEQRLETAFDDETYRRYLYYCRQQNLGERLYQNSTKWLEANSGNDLLLFGRAEGLLMSGSKQEAIKQFKELYKKSPDWASEIIFTLKELEIDEITWFILQERKRTGNSTLHAELMTDFYIDHNENDKALGEIKSALENGASASSFKRYIEILTERLGKEKVSSRLKSTKGFASFQSAIEAGDTSAVLAEINSTKNMNELKTMGRLAEQNNFMDAALAAYKGAGMNVDAARVLADLGNYEEAERLLSGNDSEEAQELMGNILSRTEETYAKAVEVFSKLEKQNGVKTRWRVSIAVLQLLMGDKPKANHTLTGIGEDDQILLAKALLASENGDNDTLKRCMDAMLVRYPASAYENDIILLYKIALTVPQYAGEYAAALAAYRWGDLKDAVDRAQRLEKNSTEIADEALLLEAESHVKLRQFKNAEECYLKISSGFPESPLASRSLFELALLQRYKMNKRNEAMKSFNELILRDPASLYADLARHEI